jgi:hypothetical protein
MKRQVLVGLFVLIVAPLFAQYEEPYGGPINVPESTNNEESDVIDGVYVKTIVPSRSMVRYEHVRESDVVWSRRVWSYIDLREKINHPLYFPMDTIITNKMDGTTDWVLNTDRLSLWSILRRHILLGDITIYGLCHPMDIDEARKDGDSFKYPIRPEPGLNYETDTVFRGRVDEKLALVSKRIAPLLDADGEPRFEMELDPVSGEEITRYLDTTISENEWYVSKNIIQYKMKEDWFFDKERSVLDVRILGVCPVVYDGLKAGGKYKELFWLYFPHLRPYLSRYYTYNEQNDAQWMSFDDLFFKRRFNAVMYKESNVYDRSVESYRMGADALMEADKIKEKIRTLEHDVWNF